MSIFILCLFSDGNSFLLEMLALLVKGLHIFIPGFAFNQLIYFRFIKIFY